MINKLVTHLNKFIGIISLLFFSINAISDNIKYDENQQCKATEFCDSLTITGEFYKVIESVCQQDFNKEMQKISKINNDQDIDPRHYLDLTKIENYDFAITKDEKENIYHINIGPKIRVGGPVYFGSTNYELDIKTLKIIKKYKIK
jgi:hypothetical protein